MSNKEIDFNNPWSYPLQWMWESRMARWEYQRAIYRIDNAMIGKPSKNLYQEEIASNIKKLPIEDQRRINESNKNSCYTVPEGKSFILRKSVDTRANQMAGGVDTYEYQINDPYMVIDDDTEDLLATKCEQDYVNNKLGQMAPTFSRDLSLYGVAAVHVGYCNKREKNNIERINPKNIWFDTRYSSTGKERFRGYSMMISWKKLKKIIEKSADELNTELEVPDKSLFNKADKPDPRIKIGKKKIKTINDLDIYVEDMNKLAMSPDLQCPVNEYWEYDHDLRSCYNLNWYRTFATDPKAQTKSGYNGNDVELTVMYDLDRRIEFKIINRRFVITANKKSFRRKIAFPIYNPKDNTTRFRIEEFNLDCPLKFQFENWENRDKLQFPTSPVMAYLDIFDELCAWRAKREHVSKILSILRVEANGADAESLKKKFNIMGVVLDDIQGDINSVQFQYDYTAIDSEIQYIESTIKEGLHAYDQFDAMQSMGDRATAAESGMAVGAIAQGLATHQNAIMELYADIARQCIANRVAYSPYREFDVYNAGDYRSITIQQMALSATVSVKPKLTKKVQERMLATNALTLLGTLRDVLTPEGIAYLEEQALFGSMPRKMAASFVKNQGASDAELALAKQQAQNQAQMLQQNQMAYEQNPIPYEVDNAMQNYSPEEVEAALTQINTPTETQENIDIADVSPVPVDTTSQEMGMTANLEGLTPDSGSSMANQTMV